MGSTPSHEQLESDYNINFGMSTMKAMFNHIDDQPSAEYILRNMLIEFATSKKGTITLLDPVLVFDWLQLDEKYRLELMEMLTELEIAFPEGEPTPNKYHEYKVYPSSIESENNWRIEKGYLFHWFKKARDGEIDSSQQKCVLQIADRDKPFITDGERIASLYTKYHLVNREK